MINLRKIGVVLLVLGLAVCGTLIGQTYSNHNSYAANTLTGNNEVITISDTTDGQPINGSISLRGYSGDGNIVLFTSNATNLPNAGSPGGLYTYNIQNETVQRIDISTNGTLPDGGLFSVAGSLAEMSETGRYVTFASQATNLIDGETKTSRYIYKRDTQTGTTSLVGAGYTGSDSDKWDRNLGISNDGRFTLVSSRYIANDYPYQYTTVIGEEDGGAYSWTEIGGSSKDDTVGTGDLSCDGMFAAIQTGTRVFTYDLRKETPITIDIGTYTSASPLISCNGRYVLYATNNRTQITPTPTGMNSYLHLVRYDRITGERIYIDSDSSNVFSTAQHTYSPVYSNVQPNIFNASIADTGDVVLDYKQGSNTYSYLKHLSDGSGTLEPIAKATDGTYKNVSGGVITSDGRYIFFRADPYDLGLAPSPAGLQLIRSKTNL